MAVFAPVTAFGQCAIFPLGESVADEAAGGVDALAGGVADAAEAEALAGVPELDLSLQLSQPGSRASTRARGASVDRTGTSRGTTVDSRDAEYNSEIR
ncbi:MAG TPA: hypothetical protein VIF09_12985, partial [Polyangiaceae bacterium]